MAPLKIPTPKKSKPLKSNKNDVAKKFDFRSDPTRFFLSDTSADDHHHAQEHHRNLYLATVLHLLRTKMKILPSAKVKMLCCAWARKDNKLANSFLAMKETFSFVEVSKSLTILDIPRQIKSIQKKIEHLKKLRDEDKIRIKDSTFGKLEKKLSILEKDKLNFGSVSGAVCRHVRVWASTLTAQELEYMAMNFKTKDWRKMANIVHFNPEKSFKSLPWFLPHCYGAPAPIDSKVQQAKNVTTENVNNILESTPLPIHNIIPFIEHLTNESKAIVVQNEDDVGRAIWHYEDLQCPEVDKIIEKKLSEETNLKLGYGKIMERLMMLESKNVCFYTNLMKIAEVKLRQCTHNLEGPIAVFADASGSMEVAIRIATIISSFLTVFTNAQLVFFNNAYWSPPTTPTSIADVINLAKTTKAEHGTAPAAALLPFYKKKTGLKTIIMVTDEEENVMNQKYRFAPLFKKYISEVGPCDIIFISFLKGQHCQGRMTKELRTYDIETTTYVLDSVKPDINKLDSIIGKMSLKSSNFIQVISSIAWAMAQEDAMTQ